MCLGKSASIKNPNTDSLTHARAHKLSISLPSIYFIPLVKGSSAWRTGLSRFIFRLLRDIRDWSVPPSPLSLPPPPWLYVNPVGTEPVGEVGAGGSYLGGAHKDPRGSRGEIAAPSELSTAPWCWTPSPSVHSWCTLMRFWDGINGFHSLRAANFSRRHLSVPSSHRALREPWIWPEIIATNSLFRSVASPPSALFSFGLSSWMVDVWTQR